MKTIRRFDLAPNSYQDVTMHGDAEVLAVGVDPRGQQPVMWAMVDTERPTVKRRIYMVSTDERVDGLPGFDHAWHIGTVQRAGERIQTGGEYHIFDGGELNG